MDGGRRGGQPVRLQAGVWALPVRDGLWLGVLDGDFAAGWRSTIRLLPRSAASAVRRALTGGGLATADEVSLAADGRSAVLVLGGAGGGVLLEEQATARLQVLLTARPSTAVGPLPATALASALQSARAALEVELDLDGLGGAAVESLVTSGAGAVGVLVRDLGAAEPRLGLHLPALPLLLAAAEADRDDVPVELRLRQSGPAAGGLVVDLDARAALQTAADAQWLIPSLLRRAGGCAPPGATASPGAGTAGTAGRTPSP